MATAQNLTTLAIATRIHLGKASVPPSQDKLDSQIQSFLSFSTSVTSPSFHVNIGIAVDAQEKIHGYNLVEAVSIAVRNAKKNIHDESLSESINVELVEVSPWGNFVPALNALVAWAADRSSSLILFVSMETQLSPPSVHSLCAHVQDDFENTLVAGVALDGHTHILHEDGDEDHSCKNNVVPLNGRTSPWNTAAVWNMNKLALTGFPLVSDGVVSNAEGVSASGVEEVSTIAILQTILPQDTAKAKLVRLSDVHWEQNFEDKSRQQWHANKMKSKMERATIHLDLLGLSGTVLHI